jgi:PrgI family protein
MQYQVPQFIEIEDKIFGPLTFKQFLYVGGGAAIGFIFWMMTPKILAIVVGGPIVGFFMAAAFYKVNGRPFLMFIEGAIKYALSSKLYIWRKTEKKIEKKKEEPRPQNQMALPKLSQSKLREISWGLDVQDRFDGR